MSELRSDDRSLVPLRSVARAALLLGAAGAMILMLRAGGRSRPLLLVPLFAAWDISPFVLLWIADRFAASWTRASRTALYSLMVIVAVGSVAYYIADAIWPRPEQPAFPYVIAPPVSWLLIVAVLGMTAMFSRKR
jgi:hypothetical protein